MFIDEITLNIWAGKGGDGIVSWMHEKGKDHAGPGGGDGGRGGDVYLKGVRDISHLSIYRFKKDFYAENGGPGFKNRMHGKNGENLVIELPIGSVVKNIETEKEIEVLTEDLILFLKGGSGGYGNDHFKSSTNIRPKQFTSGKSGQGGTFFVELKLVVDLGLVGLPNAGKSSLLNSLTRAKAKVANYEFTTLSPNLGDLHGFIIADIPGLIEGASKGKGLGYKFLRHVSRTKALLHCISCENKDVLDSYNTVREELGNYDKSLLKKPEIVLLTKTDTVGNEELKKKISVFKKKKISVFSVSIIDDKSLKNFKDELVKILRKV